MSTIVIKDAFLIDGTRAVPSKNATIVVEGNKISNVIKSEEKFNIPKGDDVNIIDAKGKVVMPGLIDSHLHMKGGGETRDYYMIPLRDNGLARAMKAIPRLKKTLEMGFTTIRDGGSGFSWFEVALRDAIERGDIVGPRYLTTGYHLTVTGGHGLSLPPWFGKYNPEETTGMQCDGPDEWRKAARLNIYRGTDNIKIVASRGFLSAGTAGDAGLVAAPPTVEEMRAAIDEAHKMGKKTSAHANGPFAIKKAIEAGIDSIVHGFYMDEECAELMVKNNIILEPTIRVMQAGAEHGKGDFPDEIVERERRFVSIRVKEFEMILKKGVKISFATDSGLPYMCHGDNAKELSSMVELGMSSMEAILTATKNASEAIGLEDKIGTIEKGKLADILIVEGNPLDDIKILESEENIKLVMKEGRIYVRR